MWRKVCNVKFVQYTRKSWLEGKLSMINGLVKVQIQSGLQIFEILLSQTNTFMQ